MFLALGEICDRRLDKEDLTRGLRVDGLGTLIGGMLNTFPHSSFFSMLALSASLACAAAGFARPAVSS